MLRGYRWQFFAFVMSAILFAAALSTRLADTSPDTTQPDTARESTASTATPTVIATDAPLVTTPLPPETLSNTETATFTEGVIGQMQRLNPLLAGFNPVDKDITSLIFEGLTALNQYGEPIPALAASWVISSDGLEYVVRLREDVLWQDGIPFTAEDVAFTMALLRAPDFPGPAAVGAFWRTVETEQLDTFLIRFRLTQPLGSFLDKLRIGILPAHALTGTIASQLASHPFNLSPIGTGPYQLEALRSDGLQVRQVDLRVAPAYRQRPEGQTGYGIDRMRFQLFDTLDDALTALAAGDIDGLAGRSRQERPLLLSAARTANYQTHTTLEPTLGVIIFNWHKDDLRLFREQRVRLALASGINRASVIERWLSNRAIEANSPLLPGSWAYDANINWPPYDPAAARYLLETANLRLNAESDEAEAPEEPSPYLFQFDILTPDDPALVNLVNEFAAQWGQLNIGVTVTPVSGESYRTRLAGGDFDAALVELSLAESADPDVYAFWHIGQYPDGLNYGGVDDRFIAEVLERARRDSSGINRIIHYRDFQRIFAERAIALPIYYPLFTYITADDVDGVQIGFVGAPSDRFLTLRDWSRRAS